MFNRYRQLSTCAIAVALCAGNLSAADEPPSAEAHGQLIAQVQAILAVKCAECHGGGVSRHEGMTLNLQELATRASLVVPFRPESSRL
jgi:mono/diheme cytochrome c family protein